MILHKLSLYQFDIVKQSKKARELMKKRPSQIRKKEFPNSINQRIFLPSEFPTQITIFKDVEPQIPREKYLKLEQKSASNKLFAQLKSAEISLESKIISLFIYRLDNLSELQQELIETASHEPNRIISVSSSFVMQKKQKRQLLKVIQKQLNTNAQVEFQIRKESNLGIELCDRGYKIFSNLDTCITEIGDKFETQTAKEDSKSK